MQRDRAARPSDGDGRLPRGVEDAACRPYPTSWWFADGPDDVDATLICMRCPVRRPCLEYALEHPELVGIWAATTAEERAYIKSARHPSLGPRPDGEGAPDP